MNSKFFIGPMSKNVTDTVINFCEETGNHIGLIPSRRQVEHDGGYVNNWRTKEFVDYVKTRTDKVIVQRDHGGALQGYKEDDGLESLRIDAECGLDLIHIDPWKKFTDLQEAAEETSNNIKLCYSINDECRYEVGTEESIHRYEYHELEMFLMMLRNKLGNLFEKVEFAVIQCGTKLQSNKNVSEFDEQRCIRMIKICDEYGLSSKEHNGDYVSLDIVKKKFDLGLTAVNIAPEFGTIETMVILEEIKKLDRSDLLDRFYKLCYDSGRWVKWFPEDFEPHKNVEEIITVSGHYVFSNPEFGLIRSELENINERVCEKITEKLRSLHSI